MAGKIGFYLIVKIKEQRSKSKDQKVKIKE